MCSFFNNYKDWIDIFSALMPSLLAGFAVFYTREQSKIAVMKRKDDLYKIRIEVYNKFLLFCNKIKIEKGWSDELTDILFNKITPHHFLFDNEIKSLIEDVKAKYREIGVYKSDGKIDNEIKDKKIIDVPEYKSLIEFFNNLPKRLERKFESYLRLESDILKSKSKKL